jgi:hypothetical protein
MADKPNPEIRHQASAIAAVVDLSWKCNRCGGPIDALRSPTGWIISVADECAGEPDRCAHLALCLVSAEGRA